MTNRVGTGLVFMTLDWLKICRSQSDDRNILQLSYTDCHSELQRTKISYESLHGKVSQVQPICILVILLCLAGFHLKCVFIFFVWQLSGRLVSLNLEEKLSLVGI